MENLTSKSSGQILYGEMPSYTTPCPGTSRIRPCGSARNWMFTVLFLWTPGILLLVTRPEMTTLMSEPVLGALHCVPGLEPRSSVAIEPACCGPSPGGASPGELCSSSRQHGAAEILWWEETSGLISEAGTL